MSIKISPVKSQLPGTSSQIFLKTPQLHKMSGCRNIMIVKLNKLGTINEFQDSFIRNYPFLKIEFYNKSADLNDRKNSKIQSANTLFQQIGLKKEGRVEINDDLLVGDLEKILLDEFGVTSQIFRKSGMGLWLETSMTNDWSLAKQNEYGREIVQLSQNKQI